MSCILRISGEWLDVDTLLSQHPLPVDQVWRKGEPRLLKGKYYSESGASFVASDAKLDEFAEQAAEATEFLNLHLGTITNLVVYPGVQNAILDFGVALVQGYVSQCSYLPPKLIQLAAKAGVSIAITNYACSDEN